MKKLITSALFVAVILAAISCHSKKAVKETNANLAPAPVEAELSSQYPNINGYTLRTISVPPTGSEEDEALLKVEIVPGIEAEVDCNKHALQGSFEEETDEKSGLSYFVYQSKGEIASTLMACPDDTKSVAFVSGTSLFTAYNSHHPTMVYIPENTKIELKHNVWRAREMKTVAQESATATQSEATEAVNAFPKTLEGYNRHLLFLPDLSPADEKSQDVQIEIIPGKVANVDCNIHRLSGELLTKNMDGWGYQYLVFNSDGTIASTRMGCPDEKLKNEFVFGETKTLAYNSKLPTVVFAPKGFEVRYRVWTRIETGVK